MAWTAAATLCCRLLRLPSARRPPSSRARCSAAQSPDAVDKEYADLNLRPLYPNVCRHPSSLRPCPGAVLTAHPSLYAEGPSHAHTAAREPAQLILLGKALLIPHPFFSRLPSEHRHSYFSANLCCVLRCVGAHGAARVEGGVRRPPASPHGRHRLRCASATLI